MIFFWLPVVVLPRHALSQYIPMLSRSQYLGCDRLRMFSFLPTAPHVSSTRVRIAIKARCPRPFRQLWMPQKVFPTLLLPSQRPNRHSIDTIQTFFPSLSFPYRIPSMVVPESPPHTFRKYALQQVLTSFITTSYSSFLFPIVLYPSFSYSVTLPFTQYLARYRADTKPVPHSTFVSLSTHVMVGF